MEIKGKRVYSKLKYESGVHRVQRVPQTETQGRVHTSTATVAIMPEVVKILLCNCIIPNLVTCPYCYSCLVSNHIYATQVTMSQVALYIYILCFLLLSFRKNDNYFFFPGMVWHSSKI